MSFLESTEIELLLNDVYKLTVASAKAPKPLDIMQDLIHEVDFSHLDKIYAPVCFHEANSVRIEELEKVEKEV